MRYILSFVGDSSKDSLRAAKELLENYKEKVEIADFKYLDGLSFEFTEPGGFAHFSLLEKLINIPGSRLEQCREFTIVPTEPDGHQVRIPEADSMPGNFEVPKEETDARLQSGEAYKPC